MSKSILVAARTLCGALLMALAACGGGGSADVNVTWTAPPAKAVIQDPAHQAPPEGVEFLVHIGGLSTRVYVEFELAGHSALIASSAVPNFVGPDSMNVHFDVDASLPPGTYDGTVKLRLCKDPQFTTCLSTVGETLTYTVTIFPRLTVDVLVNGVDLGPQLEHLDLPDAIASGSVIELRSNMPIVTHNYAHEFMQINVDASSTPEDWKAQLIEGDQSFFEIGASASQLGMPDQFFSISGDFVRR